MANTDIVDTTLAFPRNEAEQSIAAQGKKRWLAWHRMVLVGITLISVFMNLYLLGKNGYGSYYPAAVRSMLDSWHNFFFAAYDPGGFVSIDKPPVGFWLEVASAKLFGFNSVSILLPEALAGVLSVLLLYYLVRRHFGIVAGLLAALALAWQRRPRLQSDRKQQSLVLWGTWLLTMGIFFSVASFFHQYYMTMMAPAIAALFGIGLVTMWQDYRSGGWRGWLLPIAIVVTIAEQIYILTSYPTWGRVLIPLLIMLCIIAVGILLIARIAPRLTIRAIKIRFLSLALGSGVLAMLLTPTVWAAIPVFASTQGDTLVAGPSSISSNTFGGGNTNANANSKLIRYLETHQEKTKFLVAVLSSNEADGIILATNKPVMALGGFGGSDPILTTSQLSTLAKNGTIRFFLINGSGGGGSQSALTTWIKQHCKVVTSSQWQSSSTGSNSDRFGGSEQLYEYTGA